MTKYISVSRDDVQYWPLLLGSFSKTHYAQPVKTLSVCTPQEKVVFKIIEQSQSSLVEALVGWYSVPRHIYLALPFVAALAFFNSKNIELSPWVIVTAALALQCFLMSLVLYSDYHDYVNGLDRISEYNQHKPLIKGLIRPYQVTKLSLLFLLLSIAMSAPLFFLRPATLLLSLLAFGLSFLFYSSILRPRLKGFTSLLNFVLLGPTLILGLEILLTGTWSREALCIGLFFGSHAFKYDFCKQIRDIFYHAKSNISSLSTFMGFENSKRTHYFSSLFHVIIVGFLCFQLENPSFRILLITSICFEIYSGVLIYKAASFLSSNIIQCLSLHKLHYIVEAGLFAYLCLNNKIL